MGDNSTTNYSNSKKMEDSIHVDTDLTEQMSGLTTTAPTTVDSSDTTSKTNDSFWTTNNSSSNDDGGGGGGGDDDNQKAWQDFYERLNRTPPKAVRDAQFDDTKATADNLLRISESDDFQDKVFDDLNDDQQAIIILMILKGMHKVFGPSLTMNAKFLIKSLDQTTKEHKRMMSFVRKGGDRHHMMGSLMERSYEKFIQKNPDQDWNGSASTTIFKKHPNMRPFIHIQAEESYMCTYTSCLSLLFYDSYDKHVAQNGDIQAIKMNISRFIREEVGGKKIANFTLTDMKGAYLDNVLLALLQSFGTPECQEFERVSVRDFQEGYDNESFNYDNFRWYLNNGRPIVFTIETFPALADVKQTKYCGKLSDYIDLQTRPDKVSKRSYHALLCVGIQPRKGTIPPLLVVQDSYPKRQFFAIGLDLLMDMGIEDLQFLTVPKKWQFNKSMDYVMNPQTKSLLCGSPMAVDQKGVPYIVETKKPAKPDMGRYLDILDPNAGSCVFEI